MANLMKKTVCRLCGQNLTNMVYDKMMEHAERCAKKKQLKKDQTDLGDFS